MKRVKSIIVILIKGLILLFCTAMLVPLVGNAPDYVPETDVIWYCVVDVIMFIFVLILPLCAVCIALDGFKKIKIFQEKGVMFKIIFPIIVFFVGIIGSGSIVNSIEDNLYSEEYIEILAVREEEAKAKAEEEAKAKAEEEAKAKAEEEAKAKAEEAKAKAEEEAKAKEVEYDRILSTLKTLDVYVTQRLNATNVGDVYVLYDVYEQYGQLYPGEIKIGVLKADGYNYSQEGYTQVDVVDTGKQTILVDSKGFETEVPVYRFATDAELLLYEEALSYYSNANTSYIEKGFGFVETSSELMQSGYDFNPYNLTDNDPESCWVEGVSGYGEGEVIQFYNDMYLPNNISEIHITNGYNAESSDMYYKNSRAKELKIEFNDGTVIFETLKDTPNSQVIQLNEVVKTGSVTITILSVYPGTHYEDTCISDIIFY